jgi:type III pantothenate kinase
VSIAPGLGTAVNALSRDTAQLPYVQLAAPPSVIGTNSRLSIQSGIVLGYVGLVEHLIGLIRKEIGGELRVVATGGLCATMAGLTKAFDAVDVDLTLGGLALVAEYLD